MTKFMGHLASLTNRSTVDCFKPSKASEKTADMQSSPIPHKADIGHYLQYAKVKLGVRAAQNHAVALESQRYGPDILDQVPDKNLEDISIALGDVLHLKKGSKKWFHSTECKCTLTEMMQSESRIAKPQFPTTPVSMPDSPESS